MSCGIYMWTSPSGKIYIGQSRNLEKRKKDFVSIKKVYTSESSAIDNARKVYPDFSKWKYCILEKCSSKNLNEREKYYIKKYDSFTNGYNSNEGGEFDGEAVIEAGKKRARSILQYTLQGEFVKRWDSVETVSRELNITKSVLSNAANHPGEKTCLGYQWLWFSQGERIESKILEVKSREEKISETKHKKVTQYTLDGEVVKTWESIKEAASTLNISHSHISACCKGKRPAAGGFQWKYTVEGLTFLKSIGNSKERIRKARQKTVLQYSLNGDFIREWASLTIAEKTLGITGISQCINGKILTAGGYQWKEGGKILETKISEVLPRRKRAVRTRTSKKNKII